MEINHSARYSRALFAKIRPIGYGGPAVRRVARKRQLATFRPRHL